MCGIIRNGRRNWSDKSRNRHAINNIFGEGRPAATALVRIAEGGILLINASLQAANAHAEH
jgi:hypothetical protein